MFRAESIPGSPRERRSTTGEHIRTWGASLYSTSSAELEQPGWRKLSRDCCVSTSISSSGWLALATPVEVRLYPADHRNRKIKLDITIKPKLRSKEEIRSVSLSEDLLTLVTHRRLIVYEYRVPGRVEEYLVHDRLFDQRQDYGLNPTVTDGRKGRKHKASRTHDQDETWIPKSVSVIQIGSTSALIAVGGEGVNGVKLYRYSYHTGWNPQGDPCNLKCLRNNGSVRLVGFSPCRYNRANRFMVFGVTTSNRVHCWDMRTRPSGSLSIESDWDIDCTARTNEPPHRGEITSASIFLSPASRPYIFCTVNQKNGSQLLRSFVAPIAFGQSSEESRWQTLESVMDREVLSGAATANGLFLVAVEAGKLKLLTLQGVYGGLTCLARTQDAPLSLAGLAISVKVEEIEEDIKVTAIDGRGKIVFATFRVKGMPAPEAPPVEIPPVFEAGSPDIGELASS
ncbi:hypothetical protein BDV95DRAFT_309618 [Massariosphaeria phaeospora]|uniref:WD40-repeat-containing domain protein n=1 Tax=Massariosphaeria phaeospora TaxID=100035 RepID=A0A7C8IKL2_9PLEO|nr:hypothetical protein BDV95DRAFT_309618 [Massariosphaeria phaeospora]